MKSNRIEKGLYVDFPIKPMDAEDLINKKYDPLKEDFELLWNERGDYKTFENWWIDFIRYKLYVK